MIWKFLLLLFPIRRENYLKLTNWIVAVLVNFKTDTISSVSLLFIFCPFIYYKYTPLCLGWSSTDPEPQIFVLILYLFRTKYIPLTLEVIRLLYQTVNLDDIALPVGFWTSELMCQIMGKNSEKLSDHFKMDDTDRFKKARDVLRSYLIKLTSE